MGTLSSWAMSALKRDSLEKDSSNRSNIPLKVTARSESSEGSHDVSNLSSRVVDRILAAVCAISFTSRIPRWAIQYPPQAQANSDNPRTINRRLRYLVRTIWFCPISTATCNRAKGGTWAGHSAETVTTRYVSCPSHTVSPFHTSCVSSEGGGNICLGRNRDMSGVSTTSPPAPSRILSQTQTGRPDDCSRMSSWRNSSISSFGL